MSKIALIASTGSVVDLWRQATGIGVELAPWIATRQQIEEHGPFSSALCLAGWRNLYRNIVIYELIVQQIMTARLGEDREAERVFIDEVEASETAGRAEDPLAPPLRVRPAATFPSTPVLTENERVLREFGVNPALIGMLPDETLNRLASDIRGGMGHRHDVEAVARFHRIPAWAETISATEVRQEALRIVQEFYGTNAHFQTMNDSRLFACRDLARRGLSAVQVHAETVMMECRQAVHNILLDHINEEVSRAAGFLDSDIGPTIEPAPGDDFAPPAYRPQPRAYSDPLRDHLRSFMREERERRPARRRTGSRIIDHPDDGF